MIYRGALPGQTLPVEATLFNPFDSHRNYRISLQLPDGIRADVQSRDVKLGGNSESTVQFTLHVADDIEKKQGKVASVKFDYELEGTPWRGQINVPVNIAGVVSEPMATRICTHPTSIIWRKTGADYKNSFCPYPASAPPRRYSLISGLYVYQYSGWTSHSTLFPCFAG